MSVFIYIICMYSLVICQVEIQKRLFQYIRVIVCVYQLICFIYYLICSPGNCVCIILTTKRPDISPIHSTSVKSLSIPRAFLQSQDLNKLTGHGMLLLITSPEADNKIRKTATMILVFLLWLMMMRLSWLLYFLLAHA